MDTRVFGGPLSATGAGDFPSLTNVLDLLLDAVCLVDASGRFVFVSAAAEQVFGYRPDEMAGMSMLDMIYHEDLERTLKAAGEVLAGRLLTHFENRYVRKDGTLVHIMWSARWSEAHQLRIAVARDVTERKRSEAMQAAMYAISEAAYAAEDLPMLLRKVHAIVGSLLPASGFFVALHERETDELTFHMPPGEEAPPAGTASAGSLSGEVVHTGRIVRVDAAHLQASGCGRPADLSRHAVEWLGVPLIGQAGTLGALVVQRRPGDAEYGDKDVELLHYVATQTAAAIERKRMENWLQYAALHDRLTGLPNRELFHDRVENALALARRDHGRLAVLFIDLDLFKTVNDTLGHAAGDRVLQEIARRLKACVRESDTVARLGGDEFVVLLTGLEFPRMARAVAETIRARLAEPVDVEGRTVSVSPSVGIAAYPEHAGEYEPLMRQADEAMYEAKKNGGNRLQVAGSGLGNPGNRR